METSKTPCADLLAMLTEKVSIPTFATKMASAGIPAKDLATVQRAMTVGGQVRSDIVKHASEIVDPVNAHISKSASNLGFVNPAPVAVSEDVDAAFTAGLAAL